MIDHVLYTQPVVLDRQRHHNLRMAAEAGEPANAAKANALFVAAAEFADTSREYPLVFVRAGADAADPAKPAIAPMAVLGLDKGENLYFDGTRWDARYRPAYLRRYPFAMARIDDGRRALLIDRDWAGFSEQHGEPLFADDGSPAPALERVRAFVEQFEVEAERTQAACARLRDEGLLCDMRFDATLPDGGGTITVEGFLTIDETRLAALPDATLAALQRAGLLAMIHLHQASLGLMRRLVERRLARARAGGA